MIAMEIQRERIAFEMREPVFRKEKSRWPASFLLACVLHLAFFYGSPYAFVQPPDYGVQGSAASIDLYMVAALPDAAVSHKPVLDDSVVSEIPKSESEMTVSETPLIPQPNVSTGKVSGDGSSPVPGDSATTLITTGSDSIAGKQGKYLNMPPRYPALAQQNGWEGTVMVRVRVQNEGRPEEVLIAKSSGYPVLDHAAANAIKKWRFTPGTIGNLSVASWITVPVRFELTQDGEQS